MMSLTLLLSTLLLLSSIVPQTSAFQVASFSPPASATIRRSRSKSLLLAKKKNDDEPLDLKQELTAYLAMRKEVGADEAMKTEVGKIVGGTKGNKVLDFISASPAKERALEEAPNMFDYSELTKYGYSYLAKPIMEAGGRIEMYRLMGLTPPVLLKSKLIKPPPRKLVFDRTGENDKGRYGGLKMNTLMDDNLMGEALQKVQKKVQGGESLRSTIEEESYIQPFADKRNVGPQQTPLWTPAQLDEEGRKLGKAVDWARAAKAGAFVRDPAEIMAIDGSLRVYSVLSALFLGVAFGHKSTDSFLHELLHLENLSSVDFQDALLAPAVAIVAANIGSSIFSYTQAPGKNRSKVVWGIKGLLGGPLAISQLRALSVLVTRAEQDEVDSNNNTIF